MKNKFRKNEKGFALPLALLLLVVMTIMGITLVSITSGDIRGNNERDNNQQTFYAAESGISVAKNWMVGNISKFSSSPPNNLDGQLRFCKASFFPNLRSSNNGFHTDRKSLNLVISASGDEATRLSKYSFEYFIAYTPDQNGNNSSGKKKSGTNNILYTIYSCGCDAAANNCNAQNNVIIPLEAVVTLVN
jgi:Tfp pilus assembly protein PilX